MENIDFKACRKARIRAICRHICGKPEEVIARIDTQNKSAVLSTRALAFFMGEEWVNAIYRSDARDAQMASESSLIASEIKKEDLLRPVLDNMGLDVRFLEAESTQIIMLLNANFDFSVKSKQARKYASDNQKQR